VVSDLSPAETNRLALMAGGLVAATVSIDGDVLRPSIPMATVQLIERAIAGRAGSADR
jgi:hypothetical protein